MSGICTGARSRMARAVIEPLPGRIGNALPHRLAGLGRDAVEGHQVHPLAVEARHAADDGATQHAWRARQWPRTPAARRSGDSLMTFRISAVAVWGSSASLVSLNSRAFSMAIAAWSAKVVSNSTCRSVKARTSWRQTTNTPTTSPPLSNGTPEHRAIAAEPLRFGLAVVGVGERVEDLHRLAFQHHAPDQVAALGPYRDARRYAPRTPATRRATPLAGTVSPSGTEDEAVAGIAQPRRAFDQRVHVPQIGCLADQFAALPAIAVCCARASLVSVNSRTFSIASAACKASCASRSRSASVRRAVAAFVVAVQEAQRVLRSGQRCDDAAALFNRRGARRADVQRRALSRARFDQPGRDGGQQCGGILAARQLGGGDRQAGR